MYNKCVFFKRLINAGVKALSLILTPAVKSNHKDRGQFICIFLHSSRLSLPQIISFFSMTIF